MFKVEFISYITSMKKTIQVIAGLVLLALQLVLMCLDRFAAAFIPWLEVSKVSTSLVPLKSLIPSIIRVAILITIYAIC